MSHFKYWMTLFDDAVAYTEELLKDQYLLEIPGDRKTRLLGALRLAQAKLEVIFGPELVSGEIKRLEEEING